MKVLRVFIGSKKVNKKIGYYSLNIIDNNSNTLTLPPKKIHSNNNISNHRIILVAIYEFISELINSNIKEKVKLIFYTDNDQIAFEWNNEYLQDKRLTENIRDVDIYKKIISLNSIEIEIKGKDTVLNSMNKLGIKNETIRRIY